MHLVKCSNEHIYDSDKFRSCPHCSTIAWENAASIDNNPRQSDIDTEIPEEEECRQYKQIGRRKTAGMLVCIEGDLLGEGFIIREGDNIIGRAANMDICIDTDITISRKNHANIIYNQNEDKCILINTGKTDIYLNDQVVKGETELNDRDTISMGSHKFVFIGAYELWTKEV